MIHAILDVIHSGFWFLAVIEQYYNCKYCLSSLAP